MSKNMTRKGLAFGAGLALFSTGFVAIPAYSDGIQNDAVVLKDQEEYGNYRMLTTGFIDIAASFSGVAQSGAELKLYVQDTSAISVVDLVQQGSNVDAIATPTLTAYAELNGATDQLVLGFASASGIEDGDAIDGASNLTISGSDTDALALLKAPSQVASVKEVAAGNMTSFSSAVKDGSSFAVTVTKAAHGIVAGDIILIANSNVTDADIATDTADDYDTSFDGYHVVTSVTDNTFTFTAPVATSSGTTAQTGTNGFDAGTVAVHNVRVNMNNTTSITTDSGLKSSITNGTITELTDGDALDTLANLRVAKFGEEAVLGTGGSDVVRSTKAATLNDYVVDTRNTDRTNGDKIVRFGTTGDAVDGSITVTAWIDDDSDNVIDSTEYASDDLVITFVEPTAVTWSYSQNNVYIGSDTVTGIVTADLNLAEVGAQGLLTLSIDHNDGGTVRDEGRPSLAFDSTYEDLRATDADLNGDGATTKLAAGDSIRFAVESDTVEVGAAASFGVGSLTVAGSVLSIPATTNNTRGYNEDANGTGMASQAVKVRKGAASIVGSLTVYDDDPTDTTADKVVPGVPYTISVTSSAVTAADGVKFNGKVVDGGTETITGVTDASGQIALSLTQTAADASDVVTVEIDVQGLDKTALMAFTYEAADYDVYDLAGELTASTDYNTSVVVGGTLSRTYKVADQFGVAPADGTHVITASRTASSARTVLAASWNYQVPVVGGLATVTIVDNGSGTGSDTVDIASHPLLAGGGLDAEDDSNTFVLTYVTSVADLTPTAVTAVANHDGVDDTATNDQPVALEPDVLVNHDSRATAGVNPPSYETYNVDTDKAGTPAVDAQLTLTGTVTNANGGVIPGAVVTIAAAGAGFQFTTAGSATVYAADSITVRTGAAGTYSVNVYGGTGGKKTFTVTAGAASATEEVTFAAGGSVSTFTLTTPEVSKPGKTVDVSIKLTDKYGNPVQGGTITLSSTGPGYLLNTTGTTLADGTYNTKLLVGAADEGTAVISATVTIAGVETTKTASIVIGANAVAASDQKVNAGSFKGYVALYAKGYAGQRMSAKVGNDWVVVPVLASNFERVVEFTGAGYTVAVRIYIDRVLIDTITVTTK